MGICAGPPGTDIYWLATEACTMEEWAVHILLECFLIWNNFVDIFHCVSYHNKQHFNATEYDLCKSNADSYDNGM